jgi:hypothetical protein
MLSQLAISFKALCYNTQFCVINPLEYELLENIYTFR